MVAREAQVSRVAVSRAFNPHASIRPEKRARILQVAGELNYTPDRAGRALATRRSHLVGVIVPDVCSPWESQEIDALTTALQAEGFATLLFKTRTDMRMDERLLAYVGGFNPDSVIAFAENVGPETLGRVLHRATPIYVCYPDDGGGRPGAEGVAYDRLNVVQRAGIDQAVALVIGYGCRRFAYLEGDRRSLANGTRARALRAALAERGLPEPVVMRGDFTYDTAFASTIEAFRAGDGPEAIFAANDVGAFGAIDALRFELGLGVPEDVKVVGFDDIAQAHWRSYNLTTVRVDLAERVRGLVALIRRRLADPSAPPIEETVRTRLVVRGTVG
jgi:DNA-binding LacI/PurR family transcriptional regulator